MKALSHASHPRFGIGCRVRKVKKGGSILLLPEGLRERLRKSLSYATVKRMIADILGAMQALHPSSDPRPIELEIGCFLNRLLDRRAVDFR